MFCFAGVKIEAQDDVKSKMENANNKFAFFHVLRINIYCNIAQSRTGKVIRLIKRKAQTIRLRLLAHHKPLHTKQEVCAI